MKLSKIVLNFLFLFIIFIPLTLGNEFYNETGNYNQQYRTGTGFFNSEVVDTFSTRSLSDPQQAPLVSDLDQDGTNEIIVFDKPNFRLYQDNDLEIIDAYSISNEETSNFITYDIDDDNLTEIIIVEAESQYMQILEYNGTDFYNETSYFLTGWSQGGTDANSMIHCKGIDDCALVYMNVDSSSSSPFTDHVYAIYFNSSGLGTEITLLTSGFNEQTYCFPFIREFSHYDTDIDGTTEYILSVSGFGADYDVDVYVLTFNLDVTGGALEHTASITTGSATASTDCSSNSRGKQITPPLVFNIDGSLGNKIESVVGLMVSDNDFKMYSFYYDGSNFDDYPETLNTDGEIIGNIILGNFFADTGSVDFCVMGFEDDEEVLDLTCASEQTGYLVDTQEFEYSTTDIYNLTSIDPYNTLLHATQISTQTIEGVNLDDIVCSYGTFRVSYSETLGVVTGETLVLEWENPQENSAVIPVDVENLGREDLLILDNTNIYYYDDGYSNSPAIISYYYVDPCLDATWKVNESVEVRIQASDYDGDLVSTRAFLYYGDTNQQSVNWTTNSTSGTTFTFSFNANKTISTGTLRLQARDDFDTTEEDTIDLTFSVANNGVTFGSCFTESTIDSDGDGIADTTTTEESEDIIQDTEPNNSIVSSLNTITDLTGLGGLVLWVIIMICVALGVWFGGNEYKWDGSATFGIVIILEVMLLILGVVLGFIGTGILITISVIGIIFLSLMVTRWFSGSRA